MVEQFQYEKKMYQEVINNHSCLKNIQFSTDREKIPSTESLILIYMETSRTVGSLTDKL